MSKNYGNNSQLSEIVKYISDTMKFPIMGAGGGFAPIGTEAYFDGQVAPLGWIICDGTELNIADYPDLATYYASQHGASNYYGGDGITTFATPKRSGMPNNEDSVYGDNEHVIGVWRETVDGVLKEKPVWEKTYSFTISSTSGTVPGDIPPVDKLVDYKLSYKSNVSAMEGGHFASSSDLFRVWIYNGINYSTGSTYPIKPASAVLTIRYTKTSDTWQTV